VRAGDDPPEIRLPERLVPRGLPTEALVAHTMVAKFGDYLPFYRQADIYRRQGIDLDRTMLATWSGRGAKLLAPVIDAMIAQLGRSDRAARQSGCDGRDNLDERAMPVADRREGVARP
jgi:transposase